MGSKRIHIEKKIVKQQDKQPDDLRTPSGKSLPY